MPNNMLAAPRSWSVAIPVAGAENLHDHAHAYGHADGDVNGDGNVNYDAVLSS